MPLSGPHAVKILGRLPRVVLSAQKQHAMRSAHGAFNPFLALGGCSRRATHEV